MALIPASRLVDWTPGTYTGVPGGIPTDRVNIIDVTDAPYNADPTGVADSSPAFAAAITAAVADDIIYAPAGTYKLDSAISLASKNNLTIRGDGIGLTILKPQGSSTGIYVGGSDGWTAPNPAPTITAGLERFSETITIADTTDFTVGDLIQIGFQNQLDDTLIEAGAAPVVSVSGFSLATNQPIHRQISRVTAKTGTTLDIFPGIYCDPSGLTAKVWYAQLQSDGVGLEEFSIDMSDTTGGFAIAWEHCYGCWIKGVSVYEVNNYGFSLAGCLQCEIRESISGFRVVGGSNGSGVVFDTSSGCLVEDNIFQDIFPNIEVNQGSSGNVFAYNVCENTPIEGSIFFAIDSNHAPHNQFNLYEGNITPNIIADGYFGSTDKDTIFRNWLHATCRDGSAVTFPLGLKRFTRDYSIVGNVIGRAGVSQGFFSYGEPNIGNGDSTGEAEPTDGDFWIDWKATAVLTTRVSDTAGTITLDSGVAVEGQILLLRWATTSAISFTALTVVGGVVTFTGGSGTALPAAMTSVEVFFSSSGYQELDLDVENSTIQLGNYLFAAEGGAGTIPDPAGEVIPDSMYLSGEPSWWGDQPWPPVDSDSPFSLSYGIIPAGQRFLDDLPPSAPEILNNPDLTIFLGEEFELQIATDVPADSYSADDLPVWASLDIDTGLITGTPVEGVFEFTLHATNAIGTGDLPMTLTVRETRRAVITPVGGGARYGPTVQGAFIIL